MTLQIPAYLSANPHYYDYLHSLEFKAGGDIEICQGAGQLITTLVQGHYKIQDTSNKNVHSFTLYDMAEYDPYSDEKIADLNSYTIHLIQETGLFAFKQEVVWKIANPDEHPCLLYNVRYLYSINAIDPDKIRQNEHFSPSLDIYYANQDRQEVTLADLKQLGIDPLSQ